MKNYPVYVLGHKNPDSDSIISAIAYAEYKKELGLEYLFNLDIVSCLVEIKSFYNK